MRRGLIPVQILTEFLRQTCRISGLYGVWIVSISITARIKVTYTIEASSEFAAAVAIREWIFR